jgi:hypothetical protein
MNAMSGILILLALVITNLAGKSAPTMVTNRYLSVLTSELNGVGTATTGMVWFTIGRKSNLRALV